MSTITIPTNRPPGTIGALAARVPRWLWAGASLLLAGAVILGTFVHSRSNVQAITHPVNRETLVQAVTASGTVNPQNLISVGTQVSGTIGSISVDYNSKVKRGQVLARIDPSTFQAQLDQAEAALDQARAQVSQAAANASSAFSGVGVASANNAAEAATIASAKANVTKTQAALALAKLTLARDSALLGQGYIAQSSVDADRANAAQDESDVAAAQAAVAQAQAQDLAGSATVSQNSSSAQGQVAATQAAQANVAAAEAIVRQDQLNLGHTVITSPVDGTVVARDVSIGQTVAASLQTPTLFSIAQNLAKMEVDINVAEPDIGNVKPGDRVTFSVLAHPNETFEGAVSQVRINPQTVNNVVTYDVVVLVRNASGKLLPGMTANAAIEVATASDALTVPLAALHGAAAAASTPWGSTNTPSAGGAIAAGSTATLLVDRHGHSVPVRVNVALTNGTKAAVVPVQANALVEGDQVVIASSAPQRGARANGSARPPIGAGLGGVH